MSGSFDPSTSLSFHPSLREGKSISFEQYLKNTRNRSPNIQAEELESNDDASASSSIRSSSTKSASSLHSVSDSYRSFPVNSVSLRPPGPHDSDYLDDRRPSSSDLRDSMSSSTRRQPLAEEFVVLDIHFIHPYNLSWLHLSFYNWGRFCSISVPSIFAPSPPFCVVPSFNMVPLFFLSRHTVSSIFLCNLFSLSL